MHIITLTTDFGDQDPYVGIMKGVILSICPKANIIDISHNISPQNINEANFIISSTYKYFPKGTIHLCVVDPGVGSKRKPILLQTTKHFFIGPDNGIFLSILEKEKIINAIELTERKYYLKEISQTFHARDIFSPVAAYLANGIRPKKLGRVINVETFQQNSSTTKNKLIKTKKGYIGIIQHIDHFGNLITNIPNNSLPKLISGEIKKFNFKGLARNYVGNKSKSLFGIQGSHGYLEISVNKGSAHRLTKAKVGQAVKIYS